MKSLLMSFACVGALLFPPSASASSWNFVWVGNDETRYFFDADSVEKRPDRNIVVWIKTVQTTQAEKDGSWATAFRWKFNCTKKTIQLLAYSVYDKDRKFMRSSSNVGAEEGVIPDSTGEAMQKIVCESNFPYDLSRKSYFKLADNDVYEATRKYSEYKKSQVDSAPD